MDETSFYQCATPYRGFRYGRAVTVSNTIPQGLKLEGLKTDKTPSGLIQKLVS